MSAIACFRQIVIIAVIAKITIKIVVLMIITSEEVPDVVVVGDPISDEHVSSP